MSNSNGNRRVVITGMAVVCPLGTALSRLWDGLSSGRCAIQRNDPPGAQRAFPVYAPASEFHGKIDEFGPLAAPQKKSIRKGLKLMCREIAMGVAAAQQALHDAAVTPGEDYTPERSGVVYGCDHIVTLPEEFAGAVEACATTGKFDFGQWGEAGLSEVTPLWLLKYLPNMPASHIAIYNDLRGPNNSLTYREASSNAAIGEAYETIRRGSADLMIAGATGSSIAPLRAVQLSLVSPWCLNGAPADKACRPFDARRSGMVAGEGAGAIVLESLESAERRSANIIGEVLGHGSSTVIDRNSSADPQKAVANAIRAALRGQSGRPAPGHVHAHGCGTIQGDAAEAHAIATSLRENPPVVAAKSYFGNLGAAGGVVELISSLLAIDRGNLFATLNCDELDANCPINLVRDMSTPAGDSVLNLNFTPQGQASAVLAAKLQ